MRQSVGCVNRALLRAWEQAEWEVAYSCRQASAARLEGAPPEPCRLTVICHQPRKSQWTAMFSLKHSSASAPSLQPVS